MITLKAKQVDFLKHGGKDIRKTNGLMLLARY